MIKQKSTAVFLVIVNVLIWGVFLYRIVILYLGSGPERQVADKLSLIHESKIETDKYELMLTYSDPFLKGASSRAAKQRKRKVSPLVTARKRVQPQPGKQDSVKPMPPIIYFGMISNQNSGRTTGLVEINGKASLVSPYDTVEGITFKSLEKDSLVVVWAKRQFILKK